MIRVFKNLSLVEITTSFVFFTALHITPALSDEAQALECLMEKEPQMQFVVCRSYSDRLADKKQFTAEYSFLMMNVIANQIHKFSKDKANSKKLLKETLVAMFDIIKKNDPNFIQTSFDYVSKLGPAAEKKYNAEVQFLTKIMQGG